MATSAMQGRVELADDFKSGAARLECQMRCSLTWGLNMRRVKMLYDAAAWEDLALNVLKIGYADDLSYYYLGKAAEGLGHYRAAETYYRLSHTTALKCVELFGHCEGFVFPRDAQSSLLAVGKKAAETKRQYASAPKPKEASPKPKETRPGASASPEYKAPSHPPLPAEPNPPQRLQTGVEQGDANESGNPTEAVDSDFPTGEAASGDTLRRPDAKNQSSPEREKRPQPTTSAAKKQPQQKPLQQADRGNSREAKSITAGSSAAVPQNKPSESRSQAADSVTFEEINQKFGSNSPLTESQKKAEWTKYRGRCVEWLGELSYIREGFVGGVSLGFKHNFRTRTYDVLVSAPDGVQMKKGGRYTYRGTLKNYGGAILPISVEWGCR